MLSFECNRTFSGFVDVMFGVKNHNFKFLLSLDKYNIMIVMQKLKNIYAGIDFCYQCRVST